MATRGTLWYSSFFYISVRDKIGPIFQNSIPVTGFLLSSFRNNAAKMSILLFGLLCQYLKDLKKKWHTSGRYLYLQRMLDVSIR